jgi:tetratricopeptide (TPR) repeat protein
MEVEVLGREGEALTDRDPPRAAMLYGAISQIAATLLGDAPAGAAALQAASELSHDRWIAMFGRREALCARQWPRALELMRAELPQIGDPRERVALLLEIATVEEMALGRRPEARAALEEAREIDPAHAGVLEALAQIYYASAEWERLVNVLQSMADATLDVIHRSMVRHTLGLVQDVALKNPAAARAAYKLALVDDPANLAAASSLESLTLRQEDWLELARVLVLEADLLGEPRAVRRLCERAGDLYWERLGDVESAIAAYRKAARATPEEVAPLRKLAAVLESVGRWRELVEVYQQELPLVRDPEERGDLFFRIGEVQGGQLNHADEAVAAWQAALETAPTHLPTLQALGALYQNTERWPDLVRMDLSEAEKISDPRRRADRYFDVAGLIDRRIGDEEEAIRLYQRSFDLHAGHRGAFDALDRLWRREERWADLVKLYERQSSCTTDRALERYLKQEAARLWRERVPNPEKSQSLLRDALAIDAPDVGPLVMLANVLESAQKWEPLVAALEQLSTTLKDETDVIGTLHRMSRVLEIELGQEERALGVHERVLKRAPSNEVSLRAVGRLYHRAGRWQEVISCFERQLEHCQSADERASIRYRMGRIYERKLGKRDEAISSYEKSLAQSPRYTPAFRAIDRILRRDRLWPRLLEVLEQLVGAERTPIARALDWHAIGQIRELHLRDLDGAEKAYAAAIKVAPSYEAAIAALMQVHESRGDWKTLDGYYCDLLARTGEPNARIHVLIRIGLLCEFRLDDPGRAALFYKDAIDTAPLGRTLLAAELRAARREGGPKMTVRSLWRLGARATDARLRLGYMLLAALRDEGAARAPNAGMVL